MVETSVKYRECDCLEGDEDGNAVPLPDGTVPEWFDIEFVAAMRFRELTEAGVATVAVHCFGRHLESVELRDGDRRWPPSATIG